jgi:hypothetical protein
MISRAVDVATDDQKSLQDWLLWRRVLQFGWTARKQSGLYHYRRHGESMTIDWPSWTDNPSDYFARAALEKEVITLFIPLSGREALWPGLARYLERQTWPRDQTRLILMDTSQNAAFSKEVRRWIAGCDYVDVRHVCEAVAQRGIAELPRLQFAADVSLAMARIYNRMVREITTEYVWVLEDDIVPPPDACSRLLQGFDADTVSVTAAYRSRFGNAYVAWEHNQRRVETKGVGLQVIGGNGFGCVLLRSHALRETVFTATVDYAGYDNAFYHRLRRTGATAKIDWAVECDHLCTSD